MQKASQQVTEMNLRVLRRDNDLKTVEKIHRTIKFVVIAKYDQDSKQWNYLKIRGPLFLVSDKFGKSKIAIMNQLNIQNKVILIHTGMNYEFIKLPNGDGYLLNYMVEDKPRKAPIFGIWSTDEQLQLLYKELIALQL